ncbi:MaoC family dehydratase [Paenibacillus sp. FSL R10-2734]|uniref:MaoC family dehydratase n=1 Tax=Paenibacillus sp. FSL R10-2734 TaxID=2954691 RepID=UPI0030DA79CC
MIKKCITAEAIRQYAAASQDLAAIHLDEAAAAKTGFKRPIAHGMYLMGLTQSLYIAEHPTQWITEYEMKFHKPIEVDNDVIFDFADDNARVKVTLTTDAGDLIAAGAFSVKEV